MKEEYEIPAGFSPVRYFGKDKYDFIEASNVESKNSVAEWLTDLLNDKEVQDSVQDSEENDEEKTYIEPFELRKIKGKEYYILFEKDANESYKYWFDCNKNRMQVKSIKETMLKLGFEYKDIKICGKAKHTYRIEPKKLIELHEKLNGLDEDAEYDEFDEE